MRVRVVKPYQRPHTDPLAVCAGDEVTPDFQKRTDLAGWAWCTAGDGRSGWTPRGWLREAGGRWRVTRDYDSVELTIVVDEELEILAEESGFYWATNQRGESGWVPCRNVVKLSEP